MRPGMFTAPELRMFAVTLTAFLLLAWMGWHIAALLRHLRTLTVGVGL